MSEQEKPRLFNWDGVPKEEITAAIHRRLFYSERTMLAHLYLKKGALVGRHQHDNEQFTYVLKGALRFHLGEDGSNEITVREGEVLHIPSNIPHRIEALEDTVDLDVFTPVRQDWLEGKDSYFHETA
jgi:quercetin dioxygenase-like cupin family protein